MYKFGQLNVEHATTLAHNNTLNNDEISVSEHAFIGEEILKNDIKLFGNRKLKSPISGFGFTNSMALKSHGFKMNVEQAISHVSKVTLNDEDKVNEINEEISRNKSALKQEIHPDLKSHLDPNQSFKIAQTVEQAISHVSKVTLNDEDKVNEINEEHESFNNKLDEEEEARKLYELFLENQKKNQSKERFEVIKNLSKEKFEMMNEPNQMDKLDCLQDNPNERNLLEILVRLNTEQTIISNTKVTSNEDAVVKKHEKIDEKALVEIFILLLYEIIQIKANSGQKHTSEKRQDLKHATLNKYEMALNTEQTISNLHKMTLNDDQLVDI